MLTQAELKLVLSYDPEMGQFTWLEYTLPDRRKRSRFGKGSIGTIAGSVTKKGYRVIRYNDIRYYEHHLVWLYIYGYIPKELDHINGDGTDNRLINLRVANRTQQTANTALRKDNKTGCRGVTITKTGKFYASIRINGKTICLGIFETIKEASLAYTAMAEKLFGEFVRK